MKRQSIFAVLAAMVFALAFIGEAKAQTNPDLITGQVLTAAQWNALFAAKQDTLGYTPLNTAGGVLTGELVTAPSTSVQSGFNIPPGAAPGTPVNGDLWTTNAGVFAQINGATVALTGAGSANFTASNPLSITFPSFGVVNYGLNINSSLTLDGSNNLGINLTHSNVWTASQQFNSNTGAPVAPTITGNIQSVGADGANNAITVDAYGSSAAALIAFRASGGTRASKTAVTTGMQIGNVQGNGWNGSTYLGISAFVQFAAENWTTSTIGAYTSFFTSPTGAGSPSQVEVMRLQPSGGLSLGSALVATDPGAGSLLQSGFHIAKGTSLPTSAAGNTVISGTVAGAALSGNGQAMLFNQTGNGAILQGIGSVNDMVLLNKSASVVLSVPTGTTTLNFPSLSAVGTCSNSLVLDTSLNVTKGACPGAAASVQVGSTTVTSGTNAAVLYNNGGTLGNVALASGTGITLSGTANATIGLSTITGPGVLGTSLNGAGQTVTTVQPMGILLNTLTASSSATLSDTTSFTGAYSYYELVFESLIPASAGTGYVQVITSGPTTQTSGYTGQTFVPNGTAIAQNLCTLAICLTNGGSAAANAPGVSGFIRISRPASSEPHSIVGQTFYATSSSQGGPAVVGAAWGQGGTTPIIGFQFCFNSGGGSTCNVNTTSGVIKIYGIP